MVRGGGGGSAAKLPYLPTNEGTDHSGAAT